MLVKNGCQGLVLVFLAMWLKRHHGVPYVFDMDSSMPRQIADKMRILSPILPLMRRFERAAAKGALAVVPMCDALAVDAANYGASHIEVLRDISLLPTDDVAPTHLREEQGIDGPCITYIGNLEPYQGVRLLIDAFSRLPDGLRTSAHVLIVGGREDDIQTHRTFATEMGLETRVHFTGPRPVSDMKAIFAESTILASPRVHGANTPMKIYSYLDSGKPVLATNLPTHTQVLSDKTALLVEPNASAMARGLEQLLTDQGRCSKLAHAAKEEAQAKYSRRAFAETVNRLYDHLRDASQA